MKAVEWAAKFDAVPASEAPVAERFADVLKEFGVETAELVATRTKTSQPESKLPAADGAVKEQRNKFRAICGRVPTLTEDMFDAVLAAAVPDFAVWQKAAEKKKVEQKPQDDVKHYRKHGRNFGGSKHQKKENPNVSQGRKDQVRS
jgi:uncharacterized protein YecA (UPF0149 family)